jgi:uncharacterized alpha-E superfamily protein
MERADNTARILDVKYHMPPPRTGRGPARLFPVDRHPALGPALTAYHWVYRESVKPRLIAEILRDEMPRSLASCYENPVLYLATSGAPMAAKSAQRQARGPAAGNSRMEEIFQQGMHEFIGEFIDNNNRLGAYHRAISDVAGE